MSNSESPATVDKPAKRTRSPRERLLVWTGITVLLIVVFVEWRSRQGYETTLKNLEQRLSTKQEFPIKEIKNHISGLAFRDDEKKGDDHTVTFAWPSLFKKYKLKVQVSLIGNVKSVESVADNSEDSRFQVPARSGKTQLARGLPSDDADSVALKIIELGESSNGSLFRELIRQSVLIAAEDELGLGSIDPMLGQTINEVGGSQNYPCTLRILIRRQDDKHTYASTIELVRPTADGSEQKWAAPELVVPFEGHLESLTEVMDTWSHETFVNGLTTVGFTKRPPSPPVEIVEASDRLDLISQFALLRQLHAQRRLNGESQQILSELSRTYANLGSLTMFHWTPASRVFYARSLLYSQRLISTTGRNPFSLAHRAYSLALLGRHNTALESIRAAREAQGAPAPDWLSLIEAYCSYKPLLLDHGPESNRELAKYLRMRMAELSTDGNRSLVAIQSFATLNPASSHPIELMSDQGSLGVKRQAVESGYDMLWMEFYKRLRNLEEFPKEIDPLVQSAMKDHGKRNHFSSRMKLIDSLQGVADTKCGASSWRVLAALLREEAFLQAWHVLDVEANALGVNSDDSLEIMKPLYEGHRYKLLLTSFGSDKAASSSALGSLVQSIEKIYLEPHVHRLAAEVYEKVNPSAAETIWVAIQRNSDQTCDNSMILWEYSSSDRRTVEVSRFWPVSVIEVIRFDWTKVQPEEWEQYYSDCPLILNELASYYRRRGRPDDAIRCWKASVERVPTHAGYSLLARAYRGQGDMAGWQKTLEKALELPSFGLEFAGVHGDIAKGLMQQGKWSEAEPHAKEAADSYAAWGLQLASECAESLEKWDEAEDYQRAISHRYQTSASGWYYWCIRTGHGDIAEAKALAEKRWRSLRLLSRGDCWDLAAGQIIKGELSKASRTMRESYRHDRQIVDLVFAAVLADADNNIQDRDACFQEIEANAGSDVFTELINQCRGVLTENEKYRWDPVEFDNLVIVSDDSVIPYLYYLAGLFLSRHGQSELGVEYLQCAATTSKRESQTLAAHALRQAGATIAPQRLNAAPDSLAPLISILRSARIARARVNFDKSARLLDELIAERPDFLPALLARGSLNELRGNYTEALVDFHRTVELHPRYTPGHHRLVWLLATCPDEKYRDGKQALVHAQHVANRQFPTVVSLTTLAVAHAECGNFAEAVKLQSQAEGRPGFGAEEGAQLVAYKNNRPYRKMLKTKELLDYEAVEFEKAQNGLDE